MPEQCPHDQPIFHQSLTGCCGAQKATCAGCNADLTPHTCGGVLDHDVAECVSPVFSRVRTAFAEAQLLTMAVKAERATHAERGWTSDHDEEHGLAHLHELAEQYATRGDDQGMIKAASLLLAASDLRKAGAPSEAQAIAGVQRWMALDLQMALGHGTKTPDLSDQDWAEWWASLLAEVRDRGAAALRAYAAAQDVTAAKTEAEFRVADVRCTWCNLRYAEREQYSCRTPGAAHDYPAAALSEAGVVRVEATWHGNHARAFAKQLRFGSTEVRAALLEADQ